MLQCFLIQMQLSHLTKSPSVSGWSVPVCLILKGKERNVLFNDTFNTFV